MSEKYCHPLTNRDLCQKLVLKAESQEIDRIIEAFSARYYDCNPTTVFGSSGRRTSRRAC